MQCRDHGTNKTYQWRTLEIGEKMKICEIYAKYGIPENLQMHMLRVAACSKYILDHWKGEPLQERVIIRVSLLHDMGNLVKMPEDFSDNPVFQEMRKKYVAQYGTNDHPINLAIGKAEGLSKEELEILDGKRSRNNEETLASPSFERKICAYCDQRVAPDGVMSLEERLEDAKVRYRNRPLSVWSKEERANQLIDCALGIEKQIMQYCSISPEEINDMNIQTRIEQLRNYEMD